MTWLEPGTERRSVVRLRHVTINLLTRPVSTPAAEGTIGILDGVTAKGNPGREVGVFHNGKWGAGARGTGTLRITPHVWTVQVDD